MLQVNPAITLEVTDSVVLSGVLFGAMLPYLFAALTMLSVRKAAGSIIAEVRKQFRAPGIKESFLEGATPESKVQAIAAIQARLPLAQIILPSDQIAQSWPSPHIPVKCHGTGAHHVAVYTRNLERGQFHFVLQF